MPRRTTVRRQNLEECFEKDIKDEDDPSHYKTSYKVTKGDAKKLQRALVDEMRTNEYYDAEQALEELARDFDEILMILYYLIFGEDRIEELFAPKRRELYKKLRQHPEWLIDLIDQYE